MSILGIFGSGGVMGQSICSKCDEQSAKWSSEQLKRWRWRDADIALRHSMARTEDDEPEAIIANIKKLTPYELQAFKNMTHEDIHKDFIRYLEEDKSPQPTPARGGINDASDASHNLSPESPSLSQSLLDRLNSDPDVNALQKRLDEARVRNRAKGTIVDYDKPTAGSTFNVGDEVLYNQSDGTQKRVKIINWNTNVPIGEEPEISVEFEGGKVRETVLNRLSHI